MPGRCALFNLGFRPFFLGAGLFAVIAMGAWTGLGRGAWSLPGSAVPAVMWHAHEMVYGYGMAVVAGFLLTAAGNWTGTVTARGAALAAIAGLWLAARVALGAGLAIPAAAFDLGFIAALAIAVARPIIRVRQWRQLGILAKLALLGAGNAMFYAGVLREDAGLMRTATYGGVYLLAALILTIGARVGPGFIERGAGVPVRIVEPRWTTPVSIAIFLVFFVLELGGIAPRLAAACAAVLFAVLCVRLYAWHTPALWRKPLLWGLYLAVAAIAAGFLLRALADPLALPPSLPLHLFAVGGIGLATLAMMSRVALGHSGRDIHAPPATVGIALAWLVAALAARVLWPLLAPGQYAYAIAVAQGCWMIAFALFAFSYAPILWAPRADGKPG
ncbi:MAG: NnrS family protein [Gammaproteobacteria bacterium]